MIFYVNKSFYTTWLFSLGINLLSIRYDIAEKEKKAVLMHLNIESKHSCDVFVQRLTTISLGFNNKALNDNTVYIYWVHVSIQRSINTGRRASFLV